MLTDKEVLQKLGILGIESSEQLLKKELTFFWQKKYKEIKDSQLKKETIKDKLIGINEIYEELSKLEKKFLVDTLSQSTGKNNFNNVDFEDEVFSDIELYKHGLFLYRQKEYKESIIKFSDAIFLNSENANYYNYKGWALYKIEEYEEAINNFNIALELDKTKSPFFYGRFLAKLNSHKEYKFKDLFNELNNALNLPDNSSFKHEIFKHRGKLNLLSGQYNNAIQDFNELIKIKEEISNIELRIDTLMLLRKFSKAARDILRCCDLDPENIDYYKAKIIVNSQLDKSLLETGEEVIEKLRKTFIHTSWIDHYKIHDKELTFSHLDEYNKALKIVFKSNIEFFKIYKQL